MRHALAGFVFFLASTAVGLEPSFLLSGDGIQTGAVTLAALQKLSPKTTTWSEHGKEHTVRGVPLDAVLKARGFSPGPMGHDVPKANKRAGYRRALVANATDGFTAVFSTAEVMPEMGGTRVLVVWEEDGKPLSDEAGPFRLVVLTDKEPSRSLHQLERLDVVNPDAMVPRPARK